jgi:hypothetical protein
MVLKESLQLGVQALAKEQPLRIASRAPVRLAPLMCELDPTEQDREAVSSDAAARGAIAPGLTVVESSRRLVRDPPGRRIRRDSVHV